MHQRRRHCWVVSYHLVHGGFLCRGYWAGPHQTLCISLTYFQQGHCRGSKVSLDRVNISSSGDWEGNHWAGEKPSPWMKDCESLSKAPLICHPVAFSRQAGRQELLSEVPAGWKAEEGKTLSDSILQGCWPGTSCPHQGGRPVLGQHI